jgi:hypothetical protein
MLLDLKTPINSSTVVVGDLNTPLSPINRSSRQKTLELYATVDLGYVTDVYRVFHSATEQYTFYLAVHGTVSKIDYILGHKASLNK